MIRKQWFGFVTLVFLLGSGLVGCNFRKSDAASKLQPESVRMLPPVKIVGKKTQPTNKSPVVGKSEQKKLVNPLKKEEKTQVRNISSD